MKKILFTLLVCFTTVSMAQEKVLLRLNYEKGDVFLVKIATNQDMGELMKMGINMEMSMETKEVRNNIFTIETKFTNTSMTMASQGQTMSYDSNQKEEDMNPFAKGAHTKMKPLLETLISFDYDALGNIKDSKVISGTTNIDVFKENSSSLIYPEAPVSIGTTWENTRTSVEGAKMNYVYKVTSIDTEKVGFDVTGTISEIGTGTISGKGFINKKYGNIKEMDIEVKMNVMGQQVTSKIKLTTEKIK